MTLEEMFCDLYDKYGKDFNWYMIPFTQADGAFVAELNKEIGQDHFLYGKKIWAVAKCESNDDVLYVLRNGIGRDIYYLFHLTYSAQNADGFPRYEEFADLFAVKEFIERIIYRGLYVTFKFQFIGNLPYPQWQQKGGGRHVNLERNPKQTGK